MVLGFLAALLRASPGVGGHCVDECGKGDLRNFEVIDEKMVCVDIERSRDDA